MPPLTPTSPTYQLADLLLGGTLADRLMAWRDAKLSYESMAKELYMVTERRISVTHATISDWLKQLDAA